nr:hypothetical protein [Tanacetum cinerariifolium]
MMNSDHDQGTKPPAISSKKLIKNLQKDSTKIKIGTMPNDLDAQKENLLEVQENSTHSGYFTGPKRKKLGLKGKRPSFWFSGLTKNRGSDNNVDPGGLGVTKKMRKCIIQNITLKDWIDISKQEGLGDPEGVIVLDSEEEIVRSSSRCLAFAEDGHVLSRYIPYSFSSIKNLRHM